METARTVGAGVSRAESDVLEGFEGSWRVIRTGGPLLPPMWGVWKHVRPGGGGVTHFPAKIALPFHLEGRGETVDLCYEAPFRTLVDHLRLLTPDLIDGVATVGGRVYGRFEMRRLARD
ncbi:MAG: uncharacterized protein QOE92_962 [Chloroflexota bacterium]|jgi:hypothetical protein|nr:uncharacterized protein [Chloroflexota bacterium]